MTTCPPVGSAQRSLVRKPSAKNLSRPQHLSSSEVTTSEHSSLYDAAPLTPSNRPMQDYSWCSDDSDGGSPTTNKDRCAPSQQPLREGKHIGTRLFTIIEQKSVPSLKTTPSSWSFQRRVFTLQPKLSSEVAQARHSRTAQRRCYSADDGIIHTHVNKSEVSNTSSFDAASESQSQHQQFDAQPTLPIKPIYRPPERVQTPTGLPRWPGEADHEESTVRQLTVRTSRRDLLRQYLRSPNSRPKLREVLRGERTANFDQAVRTGTRFWRPPSSGHTTRRYEDLESHPFSFVPIARPHDITTPQRHQSATASVAHLIGNESRAATLGHTVETCRNERGATNSEPDAMNGPLRALRCANQSAMPVSVRQASAQAKVRSSAVPSHVRALPIVERSPAASRTLDLGTMRTIDLVDSFPSPPGQQGRKQRVQPPKLSSWSIFPASIGHEDRDDHPSAPRKRRAPARSDESESINSGIRGESQARYRQSGTPIYDPDGVSLRSFDQERQDPNGDGSPGLERPTPREQRRTESQRAISNGALRFSTRLGNPPAQAPFTSDTAENQNPQPRDNPEPHRLCKHKLSKLRRSLQKKNPHLVPTTYDPIYFDGSSAPFVLPPIVAQDYAITGPSISTRARASIAPVQPIDRPPTTTTFVTAPNGATTFTTSPTMGPFERATTLASAETSSTMPGRA